MGLRVNNNIAALNAYRNLNATDGAQGKALEKLSSGLRINRAADDAAGLAISEGLRSQVGGLKVGAKNAQDGVSLVQTAEGALTEVHSMLQRMNDLAVQHNSGAQNADSKLALQGEFDQLKEEIGRIATNTKFNDTALFHDGTATAATIGAAAGPADFTFQVGYDAQDTIDVDGTVSLRNFADSTSAVGTVDITDADTLRAAITEVSEQRASLGALQNRFEHTINNVNVAIENLSASESRIRDTDMASEMMNFTKTQILSQAGTAMLAQANQSSQGVLSLLR